MHQYTIKKDAWIVVIMFQEYLLFLFSFNTFISFFLQEMHNIQRNLHGKSQGREAFMEVDEDKEKIKLRDIFFTWIYRDHWGKVGKVCIT